MHIYTAMFDFNIWLFLILKTYVKRYNSFILIISIYVCYFEAQIIHLIIFVGRIARCYSVCNNHSICFLTDKCEQVDQFTYIT